MTYPQPKIIYGSAVSLWSIDAEETESHLKLLEELGIEDIDCSENYGNAEENLGKTNAVARFSIDTKCSVAMGPHLMTKDAVLNHAKESLWKLGTNCVSISVNDPELKYNVNDAYAGRRLPFARSRSQSSI